MTNYDVIITPARNKFDTIQLFRFIAALTVIIFHSTKYTAERLSPNFPSYDQGGSNGVNLFFVISGFVMIISSQKLMKDQDGWKIFSLKRAIRIIPIYWILTTYKVLTLIFAASLITHAGKLDLGFIIKSYLFIPALNAQNTFFPTYNVGWTLNFEVFFYVFFAISLWLKLRPIFFLGAIFISFSILSLYQNESWPDYRFYFNPIVLHFLYGMVIGKLILLKREIPKSLTFPIMIVGLLYLFLPKIGVLAIVFGNNKILLNLATFLVVFAGASVQNTEIKIPKWVVFLGGASYSLYLIHPSVAPLAPMMLKHLKLDMPWLSLLLATGISLIAGSIFYKYCETPLTEFITRKVIKVKNTTE